MSRWRDAVDVGTPARAASPVRDKPALMRLRTGRSPLTGGYDKLAVVFRPPQPLPSFQVAVAGHPDRHAIPTRRPLKASGGLRARQAKAGRPLL